jgi:hypothetical protein
MAATGPRYSKEEFVRRGTAIYERDISPLLKTADKGKYVAIDIETGEYEVANDVLSACRQLRARISDPQPWLVRVGCPYVYRFGGHGLGGRRHDGRGSGE